MNRSTLTLTLAGIATLPMALFGCGGGGSSSAPTPTPAPTATPVPNLPTRIVFVSDKTTPGNKEIYSAIVAANAVPSSGMLAGATRHITDTAVFQDEAPSISPANANKVAFQSHRFSAGNLAICSLDLSSNSAGQITFPVGTQQDTDPVWSHDGKKVAFTRLDSGNTDVYVFDTTQPPSATNPLRITNDAGVDKLPSWSPDDSRLAFSSNRASGGGDYDIYTCSPAGLNQAVSGPLTASTGDDDAPKWSPDGSRILYQGKPGLRWIVYSMPASGSSTGLVQHTDGSNNDERPSYSPDGQYVIYHSQNLVRSILSKPTGAPQTTAGTVLSTSAIGNDTQPVWGNS